MFGMGWARGRKSSQPSDRIETSPCAIEGTGGCQCGPSRLMAHQHFGHCGLGNDNGSKVFCEVRMKNPKRARGKMAGVEGQACTYREWRGPGRGSTHRPISSNSHKTLIFSSKNYSDALENIQRGKLRRTRTRVLSKGGDAPITGKRKSDRAHGTSNPRRRFCCCFCCH